MGRIRVPWTSQPQTAVGIDRSNPITRGLVFALNAANRRDSISGATAVLSGTSYQAVGLAGIPHKSPTTQVPGAFTYTVNIASAFDCTTIVVFRSVTAQAAAVGVPTLNFNSAEPVLFSSTGSQSVFSTTNNASTTITTLSAGRVYVLAGVKRVNSQEQYVNGVKVTTNVTGNRAVGAITTVSVGRPSGGNNIENAEYYEVLHFNRALSPHEVAVLSANPWQVFAPLERRIWAPAAGGGTTITCTVGNAVANGTTAAITKTVATTVGNSSADGTTANLIRVIATSTGSAAADGPTAAVTRTTATTVGNAVADGTLAAMVRAVAATTGSSVADGSTSAVTRIIATTTGDAAAAGITASIVLDGSVTIACTLGNAVADGSLAAVTRTVATTLGNAVADGLTAGLIRTIATTTGNAIADGITASITIAGQTVIGCTPANAVADGAMATVMRTITADPGNAVANGSIAALLRVIAAGPGNAVADGVTASILGATGIVCTPGNAVAAGATASIVSGSRLFLDDLSVLTTRTDYNVTTLASPLVVTTQTSDLCV